MCASIGMHASQSHRCCCGCQRRVAMTLARPSDPDRRTGRTGRFRFNPTMSILLEKSELLSCAWTAHGLREHALVRVEGGSAFHANRPAHRR